MFRAFMPMLPATLALLENVAGVFAAKASVPAGSVSGAFLD